MGSAPLAVLVVWWLGKASVEERFLRERYPGYQDYCLRVRHRLIRGFCDPIEADHRTRVVPLQPQPQPRFMRYSPDASLLPIMGEPVAGLRVEPRSRTVVGLCPSRLDGKKAKSTAPPARRTGTAGSRSPRILQPVEGDHQRRNCLYSATNRAEAAEILPPWPSGHPTRGCPSSRCGT